MNKLFLLLLVLVSTTSIYAQSSNCYSPTITYKQLYKVIPVIENDAPDWVHLLYAQDLNIDQLQASYEAYHRENIFEKTTHTQNYKYLMRQVFANGYYQQGGDVVVPSLEEEKANMQFLEDKYESILAHQNNTDRLGDWQCIGPIETFSSNGETYKSSQTNVYTIDQSPSNPNVLYAGAEGGFLFKSTDKAQNWNLISPDLALNGIGAIKIDPTDENIVYMGQGHRLYKTTNGGNEWNIIDELQSFNITDIAVLPNTPQVVLSAGQQGLRRSEDGGQTWTTILTDRCWDLEIKIDDEHTIWVAKSNPTKNCTEIWKSIDGGLSFTPKVAGWYEPIGGVAQSNGGARIAVTNADPNRVYVVLLGNENDNEQDNNYIGIYRSDDGGETWTTPYDGNGDGMPDNEPGGPYGSDHWCFTSFNENSPGYDQGFYNLAIDVSDTDPDLFLVGFLNLFKSDDGGVTYKAWGGYRCHDCGGGYRHPDIQEIEINGDDVWVTSDGGVDLYSPNFEYIGSHTKGITGAAYWGLGQGWNEDVLTGGRYHNGNAARYENYGHGKYLSLGGAESATGYVNQGYNREVQHSDISGKLIPITLTGGVTNIPKYSLFPNQSYYSNDKSEVVTHPYSWETLFIGKDNKFWKSQNNGASFEAIGTFGTNEGDKILGIEVARTNPDIIYIVQKKSGGGKVWKTLDGGDSWGELNLPATSNQMFISVAADNEDEIYLATTKGWYSNEKIYRSLDGGETWTNLSTPIFDEESIHGVQVQDGTDGGVYVITNKKVYYKNNSIDWQLYADGLPAKINYQALIPFYRDGKLRLAIENGGIWESPLYESPTTIAQPMVKNGNAFCAKDTIFFDSYSIAEGQATYSWDFSPDPIWVNSTTVRNPKVLFGNSGNYSATLTITTPNGTDTKTVENILSISAECDPEQIPGLSLICNESGDYATLGDIGLETNELTITAWIKPSGIQSAYSGILMNNGSDGAGGFNFKENNQLGYHWPNGGAWWWNSELYVPTDEWSHVAMVVSPNGITLYLNGEGATHNFSTAITNFHDLRIGTYNGWGDRNYKGQVDEVCIYDRALTTEEIRATRHLTKIPQDDLSLIHYYQFNRLQGSITDRVGIKHGAPNGNASRLTSTAPIGGGTSHSLIVNNGGVQNFENANVLMTFPNTGTYPNGEIVVSQLNVSPDFVGDLALTPSDTYWIINNYGNDTFSPLERIEMNQLSSIDSNYPNRYKLHQRQANGEGDNWSGILDEADESTLTSISFVEDNGITSFGQFVIHQDEAPVATNNSTISNNQAVYVFPNPLGKNELMNIFQQKAQEAKMNIYDNNGKEVMKIKLSDRNTAVDCSHLSSGMYFYWYISDTKMEQGKLIIE